MKVNLPLLVIIAMIALPSAAEDEETRQLREEVQELRSRIVELEKQLAAVLEAVGKEHATPPVDAQPADSSPERTIGIGGRVKFDAVYNSRSVGGPGGVNRADTAFSPGSIPLSAEGESDQFSSSARDSRLWFDSVLPTRVGDLNAYIEIDFAAGGGSGNERVSNPYNPRLRHAYAELAGFTAGQTYTTFLDVLSYPETNDASGPAGINFNRQPLLRYEAETGFGAWKIAIEQPETVLSDASGNRLSVDDDRFPDLVARVDINEGLGRWSVSALSRQIRADGIVAGREDTEWGYGLSVSGRLYLQGLNNVRFSLTAGEGIGRYVAFNSFNAGSIDGEGNIELIPISTGFIAYQHWWSDRWRSNWVLSAAEADIDINRMPASLTESVMSSHLNLVWSPLPETSIGLEWLYGRRTLANGETGILNRLQLTSMYKFRR